MATGIILFGSSGSGKTTLGKMTAEALGFPYFDLDGYIWRGDTEKPFTVMYSKEEKISRLMEDISRGPHFVIAGSMDSFNAPFVPLFDLAVFMTASLETRLARIRKREFSLFGDRILEGGDLYEDHQRFLESSAQYDTDHGSPCFKTHEEWANSLPCKVLRLDGEEALNKNRDTILREYKILKKARS